MRRIAGTLQDLSEDEYAQRESLRAEQDRLEEQYAQAEELPDEIDQRLGEIETALDGFENRPRLYDAADKARAIAERQERWKAEMPENEDALWDYVINLDDKKRAALLAHCVSLGITALHERADRHGGSGPSHSTIERRIGQADRLANAVDLDMVAAGWKPTVENYLGRVTKPRILEAVREAKPGQAPGLLLYGDSPWLTITHRQSCSRRFPIPT